MRSARAKVKAEREELEAITDRLRMFSRKRKECTADSAIALFGCGVESSLGIYESPSGCQDIRSTGLGLPVSAMCTHVLSEISPAGLKSLRLDWEQRHLRIDHASQLAISPNMPKAITTRCRQIGFCVCNLPKLRKFVKQVKAYMRELFSKGGSLRAALDMNMVIMSLRHPASNAPVFWHLSFINLTTLDAAVIPLQPDDDEINAVTARALGKTALSLSSIGEPKLGAKSLWSACRLLDLNYQWHVACFCLDSSLDPLTTVAPTSIVAAKVTNSFLVWFLGRRGCRPRPKKARVQPLALLDGEPLLAIAEANEEDLPVEDDVADHSNDDESAGTSSSSDETGSSSSSSSEGPVVEVDDELDDDWVGTAFDEAMVVAELAGLIEDAGYDGAVCPDADGAGVGSGEPPPAPIVAPDPPVAALPAAPIAPGPPGLLPPLLPPPAAVPPDALDAARDRRAGDAGWPRICKTFTGDPPPPKGWSFVRRSVNKQGIWDFKACCSWCGKTMSRTSALSSKSSMKGLGQGRPLGLLWAWLSPGDASAGASCGPGGVTHSKYWPSFDDRVAARILLRAVPESEEFLELERPPVIPVRDSLRGPGEPFDIF